MQIIKDFIKPKEKLNFKKIKKKKLSLMSLEKSLLAHIKNSTLANVEVIL